MSEFNCFECCLLVVGLIGLGVWFLVMWQFCFGCVFVYNNLIGWFFCFFLWVLFFCYVKIVMFLFCCIFVVFFLFQNCVIGVCLFGGLLVVGVLVQVEEVIGNVCWVSDSLIIFVCSGFIDGYCIVGIFIFGQKVELFGIQGNYSQVCGENGSIVWIFSCDLQEVFGQVECLL